MIEIAAADRLVKARTAYVTLGRLATWLPWVVVAVLAMGVYVARPPAGGGVERLRLRGEHAGAGRGAGNHPGGAGGQPAGPFGCPVVASYDIVVRFLRDGLRVPFVLGLVVALVAFLACPVSLRADRTWSTTGTTTVAHARPRQSRAPEGRSHGPSAPRGLDS